MASEIKPIHDENREVLSSAIPLRTPFSLQIAPSSVCNFRCNYCINSSLGTNEKHLMSWNVFGILCDQLSEFEDKLKQINIAGWGEPTINKLLPEMVNQLKERETASKVVIITNGSLLNHDYCHSLINSGADCIKISIQGITSKQYAKTCGVSLDINTLIRNIEYIYINKKQCELYVKIADIALDEGQEQEFYSIFSGISDRMFIENIRPIFDIKHDFANTAENVALSKYGKVHPPVDVCPQPFYMMSVTPEGNIYPCCSYYDPTNFGNIQQSSLKRVWDSDQMLKFQKTLLRRERRTQKDYPVCTNCKIPDAIVLPEDDLDPMADSILERLR